MHSSFQSTLLCVHSMALFLKLWMWVVSLFYCQPVGDIGVFSIRLNRRGPKYYHCREYIWVQCGCLHRRVCLQSDTEQRFGSHVHDRPVQRHVAYFVPHIHQPIRWLTTAGTLLLSCFYFDTCYAIYNIFCFLQSSEQILL